MSEAGHCCAPSLSAALAMAPWHLEEQQQSEHAVRIAAVSRAALLSLQSSSVRKNLGTFSAPHLVQHQTS